MGLFWKRKTLYTCPCYGYKTLEAESPGSYMICEICFWEDDPVQFEDPDFELEMPDGGQVSLRKAQKNFKESGCSEARFKHHVRTPKSSDVRDPDWKPLDEL